SVSTASEYALLRVRRKASPVFLFGAVTPLLGVTARLLVFPPPQFSAIVTTPYPSPAGQGGAYVGTHARAKSGLGLSTRVSRRHARSLLSLHLRHGPEPGADLAIFPLRLSCSHRDVPAGPLADCQLHPTFPVRANGARYRSADHAAAGRPSLGTSAE